MKRTKHNKKRNTAFLYEALVREATKAIVSKDDATKRIIINLLKEFFAPSAILAEELNLYAALSETHKLASPTAEKLVYQVREAHSALNQDDIYNAQSQLIRRINSQLSSGVYTNFVPNYKSLATISQLFGSGSETHDIKRGVILEQQVVDSLIKADKEEMLQEMKPIDNLVFKTFVSKFNESYADSLLSEQKELLNKYILSFIDNGIDVKIYLNEEISRLHNILTSALKMKEINSDEHMFESTKSVLKLVENFKEMPINKALIKKVMKVQDLVREIKT
tara:strand:+ start:388 stop:1224 length:837 start_codon:yes stop_codon:yes gene_type:complete